MSQTVSDGDLRRLVVLVEEARRDTPAIGFPPIALDLARRLVRCDFLTFLEYEHTKCHCRLAQEEGEEVQEDPVADDMPPFWANFWDCPPCSYSVVTGDKRTVTAISDFYSQRQWHQTPMYNDCLTEVEHSAVMNISSPEGVTRRLVFFRCDGPDFDARDRLLLSLMRPHFDELYQDLQRRRRSELGLSTRQRQLLGLVAAGYSNTDIARELAISAATVRTHLEKVFKLLDVTSRTAAVAKAFPPVPY